MQKGNGEIESKCKRMKKKIGVHGAENNYNIGLGFWANVSTA